MVTFVGSKCEGCRVVKSGLTDADESANLILKSLNLIYPKCTMKGLGAWLIPMVLPGKEKGLSLDS